MEREVKREIEVESLVEIFDGVKKDLESRQSTPRYPTGLSDLDRIVWGLHKKELMTIGARPSEGKTALIGQIAFNLADRGITSLIVSMEMSKEQIVERLFCNITKTNNLLLREGKLTDDTRGRIPVFEKMIETLPLLVVDKCGYNFCDIEKLIKTLEPKPDVVFIDYIQLISQGKYSSKTTAIEEYFRKLKEMSVSENIAIVVLSQIRRMDEHRQNRRPTMEELKGSGALEEHSDTVALIYWIKHNEFAHRDVNEFELNIAKQRHGAIGLVKLNFYPQYYVFEDRSESQKEELF